MSPRAVRQQIGQLLMAGFDGASLTPELRALAREFSLGGVVIFKRNVEAPEQVAEVAAAVRELDPDLPPWFAVDQEGGRVARLRRPFTEWPPMATLGRSGDEGLARRFARALAREMAAVGVTLDFAPVLDVLTNPRNPAIGDRAIGDRADEVARLGTVIVQEFQAAGVAACGKHFPGHGETGVDSHLELPIVDLPPDRIRAVELEPFRAAIAAGVASILTAHVLLPCFDEDMPATLSRSIVTGLLRDELGYQGLVFTDDMEMKAVAAKWPVPDAAVQAVAAGCDAVLVCSGNHDLHYAVLEALVHAVEQERVPWSRVDAAIARQRDARAPYVLASDSRRGTRATRPDGRELGILGCDEHQAIAYEMAGFA